MTGSMWRKDSRTEHGKAAVVEPARAVADRQGVPKDLEARLHLAWLRSQLNAVISKADISGGGNISRNRASKAAEQEASRCSDPVQPGPINESFSILAAQQVPASSAPTLHSTNNADVNHSLEAPSRGLSVEERVRSDLNPRIHDLWNAVGSGSPISRGSNDSAEQSYTLHADSHHDSLVVNLIYKEANMNFDLTEEDLFKGLEDLSGAFGELEELLPDGPGGFVSPALAAHDKKDIPPENNVQNNVTLEQRTFLQELVDEQGDVLEAGRKWNGISAPPARDLDKVPSLPAVRNNRHPRLLPEGAASQQQRGSLKRSLYKQTEESSTADSSSVERRAVPRTNGAQAGAQAAAMAGASAAATVKAQGVNPIELLVAVAQAIVKRDQTAAHKLLGQLFNVASIYGDASQRLSAYFLEGLTARISGEMPRDHMALIQPVDYKVPNCTHNIMEAFQSLMASTPYLTFGQVTVNCAILESFVGVEKVHIVDFGIGHGLQWPPLFQALSARPGGPPLVRMTAIDLPSHGTRRAYCIEETGERLKAIAWTYNIALEYHPIPSRLENVLPERINLYDDEVLAVNCSLRLHQLLDETATPTNPRSIVLRTIRALKPKIFTVVEQHTNHNSPFFLARFYEALYYYAGLFDSVDASVPAYSPERLVFEQQVLGRSIVNCIANEGVNRVERQECFGHWQARMQKAGFRQRLLSANVAGIAHELLKTYHNGYGLRLYEADGLLLTWQNMPLLCVSTWEPDDVGGGCR